MLTKYKKGQQIIPGCGIIFRHECFITQTA